MRSSRGSSTAPAARAPSSTSSPRANDHAVEGIPEQAAPASPAASTSPRRGGGRITGGRPRPSGRESPRPVRPWLPRSRSCPPNRVRPVSASAARMPHGHRAIHEAGLGMPGIAGPQRPYRPHVQVYVALCGPEHAMARLADTELVADVLELNPKSRSASASATVRSTSTIGFAASPGTAVDPMCSTRTAALPRARRMRARSRSKRFGQPGSGGTITTRPGSSPPISTVSRCPATSLSPTTDQSSMQDERVLCSVSRTSKLG